jgi:hypothetical protein
VNLPDFVIAGAYRGGTTTLRRWLGEHPQIFMPSLAEPSFFAFDDGAYPPHMLEGANDLFRRRRTTSFDDYLQLFQSAPSGAIRGECSPEYLRATGSAARIAETLPDCRVIFSLRNPVDRLISDWKMCRRDGAEKLGLRAALDLAAERNEHGEFGGHYLATSHYAEGLMEFFETFPRSNILVLIQERWTKNPHLAAQQLGEFLDVDTSLFNHDLATTNRSGIPTSRFAQYAWTARRRAAPYLSGHIPQPVKRAIERRLETTLDDSVNAEDRNHVRSLLAGERANVSQVIGDEVPEWT